jgi:hypothetical protein
VAETRSRYEGLLLQHIETVVSWQTIFLRARENNTDIKVMPLARTQNYHQRKIFAEMKALSTIIYSISMIVFFT